MLSLMSLFHTSSEFIMNDCIAYLHALSQPRFYTRPYVHRAKSCFYIHAWYRKWAMTETLWMTMSGLWSKNKENSCSSSFWCLSFFPALVLAWWFIALTHFFLSLNRTPVILLNSPCENTLVMIYSSFLSSWLGGLQLQYPSNLTLSVLLDCS